MTAHTGDECEGGLCGGGGGGGYVNGQCKAVIHDLVSLVHLEGLCDQHNLRLNV